MLRPSMRGGVPVLSRSTTNGPFAQALRQRGRRRIAGAAAGVVASGRRGSCRRGRCRRSAPPRGASKRRPDLREHAADAVAFDDEVVDRLLEQRSGSAGFRPSRRIAALYSARSAWQRVARTAGPLEALSVRHWMPARSAALRHHAAERVDLLDQMALADAADGRVAAHLADGFDAVGQQQGARAGARRRPARLRCRRGRRRSRSRHSVGKKESGSCPEVGTLHALAIIAPTTANAGGRTTRLNRGESGAWRGCQVGSSGGSSRPFFCPRSRRTKFRAQVLSFSRCAAIDAGARGD